MSGEETLWQRAQTYLDRLESQPDIDGKSHYVKSIATRDTYEDFTDDATRTESWRDLGIAWQKLIDEQDAAEKTYAADNSNSKYLQKEYAEHSMIIYRELLISEITQAGSGIPECDKVIQQINESEKKLFELQYEWAEGFASRWTHGDNAVESAQAKDRVEEIQQAIVTEKEHLQSLTFDGIEIMESIGKDIPLRAEISERIDDYNKKMDQAVAKDAPTQEIWENSSWELAPFGDTLESNQQSKRENKKILSKIRKAAVKEIDATRPDLDLSKDQAYKSLQSAEAYANDELANAKAYAEHLEAEFHELKMEWKAQKGFWNRAIYGDHRQEIQDKGLVVKQELELAKERIIAAEKTQEACKARVAEYKSDRDIRYDKAVAAAAPEQKIVEERIRQADANIQAFKAAKAKEIGYARVRTSELAGDARREKGRIVVHNHVEVNQPHKDGEQNITVTHADRSAYQPLRDNAASLDVVNMRQSVVTRDEAQNFIDGAKAERAEVYDQTRAALEKSSQFAHDPAGESLKSQMADIDKQLRAARARYKDAETRELRAESKLQCSQEQDAVKRGFFEKFFYESKTQECGREVSLAKLDKQRMAEQVKSLEARRAEIQEAMKEHTASRAEQLDKAVFEARPDLHEYDTVIHQGERTIKELPVQDKQAERTQEVSREHDYKPPQKIQDRSDSSQTWEAIQANEQSRREIYAMARQEAMQEIGSEKNDPAYQDVARELSNANEGLHAAKAEEQAAALERTGAAKELRAAERELAASKQEDSKHRGAWNSLGYNSKTIERHADRDEAKSRDEAAQKRQEAAKAAREKAEARRDKAMQAYKEYQQKRSDLIKQRTYEKAPVLKQYDKVLANDRARYQQAKVAEHALTRSVEIEASRENGYGVAK